MTIKGSGEKKGYYHIRSLSHPKTPTLKPLYGTEVILLRLAVLSLLITLIADLKQTEEFSSHSLEFIKQINCLKEVKSHTSFRDKNIL